MDYSIGSALEAAREELEIEIAESGAQIEEAQRLRYKVYCDERGFEPGENGLEQDEFDGISRHVLVRSRLSRDVLGTVRVVIGCARRGAASFPMNRVCERYVLAPLPAMATAEISRFALTRDRPGVSPAAAALMRLFLMRGIVTVSGERGLTHWCAIMERSLLRLLRATAIHFEHVGPVVEYHGTRQPAVGAISTVLGRIRTEKPLVWSFITGDGALWQERPAALAEPARRYG
jgi:N-acyl-L-homoserine lactone synthetase